MYLINTAGEEPELVLLWNLDGELHAGGRNGDQWHIVATNPFKVPLFTQVLVEGIPQHAERVVAIRPGAVQRITLQPIELTPHTLSSHTTRRGVIRVQYFGGNSDEVTPVPVTSTELRVAAKATIEARRVPNGMTNPSYEVTVVPRFSWPLLAEIKALIESDSGRLDDVFDTPEVADIIHSRQSLHKAPRALRLRMKDYTYN